MTEDPTEYPEKVPGELGTLDTEDLLVMALKRVELDWDLLQKNYNDPDPTKSGLAILAASSAATGFEYIYNALKLRHTAEHFHSILPSEYFDFIKRVKREYERVIDESGTNLIGNIGEAYAKKAAEGG